MICIVMHTVGFHIVTESVIDADVGIFGHIFKRVYKFVFIHYSVAGLIG